MTRQPLISLRDVTFQYRTQAQPTLRNINLEVFAGEKVAIIGQSGSGKSTLMHLLNGMIPHYYPGKLEGQVQVAGLNPTQASIAEVGQKLGTVLQDADGQFVGLTVREDIAFSLENQETPVQDMPALVEKAAAQVHIDQALDAAPQNLSGGQKQRVAMAGVLVDDVDILLFDEPLASLDPATGRESMQLIDRLQRDLGKTILIVEHRLEDVLYTGVDRIVLLAHGEIIADTTPAELLSSQLLPQYGIRTPLYLDALALSGQYPRVDDQPEHVNSVKFDAEKLRTWAALPTSPTTPTTTGSPKPTFTQDSATPTSTSTPLLQVSNLSKTLGDKRVLNQVSFSLARNEMVAILGNNGAGKSTLARLICNFLTPDAGSISYDGTDLKQLSIAEVGQKVGFVLQNPNHMISQPTIQEEIRLGLKQGQKDYQFTAEDEAKIESVLKLCGLWKMRSWPISALSYGQKKRVTVASVLVLGPELIILDEPTAGQDFAHYSEIMQFLRTLNENGHTILLITHDMHLALEYANRALVLSAGELLADAPPATVLTDQTLSAKAGLVTTSLYDLAERAEIVNATAFVNRFINAGGNAHTEARGATSTESAESGATDNETTLVETITSEPGQVQHG